MIIDECSIAWGEDDFGATSVPGDEGDDDDAVVLARSSKLRVGMTDEVDAGEGGKVERGPPPVSSTVKLGPPLSAIKEGWGVISCVKLGLIREPGISSGVSELPTSEG